MRSPVQDFAGERNSPMKTRLYCWMCALIVGLLAMFASHLQGQENKQLVAVCSTTQVADLTRQVTGDRWRVESVLAPGQDPHMYEIKPGDAKLVGAANLCLENGWHLEGKEWMKTLAKDANKPLVTCVTGVPPLVIDEAGAKVNDPHAWFTPVNASVFVRNIVASVCKVDPDNASEYKARATLYLEQLRSLHLWIRKQVAQIPDQQRVLVTSHDAFGYFCRGYGFRAAAPAGWSTSEETGGGATKARRDVVVDSIRQFGVKAIFVETSVNPKLINQIAQDAGVKVGGKLYSDSMGKADTAGATYIGMMRENVLTIVEALK